MHHDPKHERNMLFGNAENTAQWHTMQKTQQGIYINNEFP